jgi:hypothetical protein
MSITKVAKAPAFKLPEEHALVAFGAMYNLLADQDITTEMPTHNLPNEESQATFVSKPNPILWLLRLEKAVAQGIFPMRDATGFAYSTHAAAATTGQRFVRSRDVGNWLASAIGRPVEYELSQAEQIGFANSSAGRKGAEEKRKQREENNKRRVAELKELVARSHAILDAQKGKKNNSAACKQALEHKKISNTTNINLRILREELAAALIDGRFKK